MVRRRKSWQYSMSLHNARSVISGKSRGGWSRSGKRFWQVTPRDIVVALDCLRNAKRPKKYRYRRGQTIMAIRNMLIRQGMDVTHQQIKVALHQAVVDGLIEDVTNPSHRRYDLPESEDGYDDTHSRGPQPECSSTTTCNCSCQQQVSGGNLDFLAPSDQRRSDRDQGDTDSDEDSNAGGPRDRQDPQLTDNMRVH